MRARIEKPGEVVTSAGMFGELLRDIRETAGVSQARVAAKIPCDRSQIARIELGTRIPALDVVQTLDRVLETGGFLARMWRKVDWHPTLSHPDWFQRRAAMDAKASAVREYGTDTIPGLLQAPEYVRALYAAADPGNEGDLEERVEARLGRQLRFLDPEGPLLMALLEEACLRRVVGGAAVMRKQCERLLDVVQLPNIYVRVLRLDSVADRPNTAMSLLTLPQNEQWVYSESLDQGHFISRPEEVAGYVRTYDVLGAHALNADDSAALIREAMEGYADDEHPRHQRRKVGQEQLQRQQRRKLRRSGPRLYGRRPRT